MKITYDPSVDAMNIKFQDKKYKISKEIADGIIVDFDKEGKVIAIEILDAKERMPLKSIQNITVGIPTKKVPETAGF